MVTCRWQDQLVSVNGLAQHIGVYLLSLSDELLDKMNMARAKCEQWQAEIAYHAQ
jgi:hypothetical protein